MEPIDLFIYSNNKVASDALFIFNEESELIEDVSIRKSLKGINSEAFSFLSGLLLEKLFISATSSNSLFYRFKMSNIDYDFMMEVFLDFDGNGNVGATLQVYKNSSKLKSFSGTTDNIYNAVINTAFENDTEPVDESEFLENSDFGLYLPPYA